MARNKQVDREKVLIGKIGKTCCGGTPSSKHPEYFRGTIPWIGTTALNGKRIDESDAVKLITEEAVANSATKLIPANSIMVGIRVGVGKVAINSVPMCTSQDIVSIVGVDDSIWSKEYVALAIKFFAPALAAQARGATIIGISSKTLKAIAIPRASRDKQDDVVYKLRSVEKQIQAARRQIGRLETLVKSRFAEMFGDRIQGYKCPKRKLGSISKVGSSRRVFKSELLDEGIPFYRGTEISALSLGEEISPELFISKKHYDMLVAASGKPEIGDLLMASICPEGQIWCVDTNKPFYFKDGRVLWVRPDKKIVNSAYLRHALGFIFQTGFSEIASGTTFAELKIFILKDLEVPIPSMSLQQEFAGFVQQVDKSKSIARKQVEKLQLLYDSLAQEYFGD